MGVYGGTAQGGGIYIAGGGVLSDVTVSNAATWAQGGASRGGAIYVGAGAVLLRVKITNASATSGVSQLGANGGAIFVTGNMSLASVVVVNASAGADGGAVYSQAAQTASMFVSLTGVSLIRVVSASGSGGGLFLDGESQAMSVILNNVSIQKASAWANGGGLFVGSPQGRCMLTNVVISDASAGGSGGGAYFSSSVSLQNGVLNNTMALKDGGGLWVGGDAVLQSVAVTNASAGNDGGGLAVPFGSVSLQGGSFSFCASGTNGGALSAGQRTALGRRRALLQAAKLLALRVESTSFIGCSATETSKNSSVGGAVSLFGVVGAIMGAAFVGCSAASGGATYLDGRSSLSITSTSFNRCSATTDGAGVFVGSGATLLLTSCSFIGGASGGNGGALSLAAGAVLGNMTSCQFISNIARLGGGAAYLPGVSSSTIAPCLAAANSSHCPPALPSPPPSLDDMPSLLSPLTSQPAILCCAQNNTASWGPVFATDGFRLIVPAVLSATAGVALSAHTTLVDALGQPVDGLPHSQITVFCPASPLSLSTSSQNAYTSANTSLLGIRLSGLCGVTFYTLSLTLSSTSVAAAAAVSMTTVVQVMNSTCQASPPPPTAPYAPNSSALSPSPAVIAKVSLSIGLVRTNRDVYRCLRPCLYNEHSSFRSSRKKINRGAVATQGIALPCIAICAAATALRLRACRRRTETPMKMRELSDISMDRGASSRASRRISRISFEQAGISPSLSTADVEVRAPELGRYVAASYHLGAPECRRAV